MIDRVQATPRGLRLQVFVVAIAGMLAAIALVLTLGGAAAQTATRVAIDVLPDGDNTFNTIGFIDTSRPVAPGETFDVDLVIEGVDELQAYNVDLTFDNTTLEFLGVTERLFILSGGVVPGTSLPINTVAELNSTGSANVDGTLAVGAAISAGLPVADPTGIDGVLARLTFRVRDAAVGGTDALFTIGDVDLVGADSTMKFTTTADPAPKIVVTIPFDNPVAVDDPGAGVILIRPGQSTAPIDVTANDTPAPLNGNGLDKTSVVITTPPVKGTAVVNDGTIDTITYTADPTFQGEITFEYSVGDNSNPPLTDTALVTIMIDGTPPVFDPVTDIVVLTNVSGGADLTATDFTGRTIANFLAGTTANDAIDPLTPIAGTPAAGTPTLFPLLAGQNSTTTTVTFEATDTAGNTGTTTADVTVLRGGAGVDLDADGSDNETELHVGTDPATNCSQSAPGNLQPDVWAPDINGDGIVDILDALAVVQMFTTQDQPFAQRVDFVITSPNRIDILDALFVVQNYGPCPV